MSLLSWAIVALIGLGLIYIWRSQIMVSMGLVIINFATFVPLFILGMLGENALIQETYEQLGFRGNYLAGTGEWWSPFTLISSIFIHASPGHLFVNMLMLVLFGVPFEQRVKGRGFARVYFVGGLGGSLIYGVLSLAQEVPGLLNPATVGVGASGAIFAVMGAFVRLHPDDEIPMLLVIIFLQRVPVIVAALVFAAIETLFILLIQGGAYADNVGHIVHMASFGVGALIAPYVTGEVSGGLKAPKYDLERLSPLASEQGLLEELKAFQQADEPELRQVWAEHFWSKLKCPECRLVLGPPTGKQLKCDCGFRLPLVDQGGKGS